MLAEHNVEMGSRSSTSAKELVVTGLAQVTQGICSLGSRNLLFDFSCEDLALCTFYLNSRLNFLKVIRSAVLQHPQFPIAVNPLSVQLQVRLFRLSPAFVESLMGAEWNVGGTVAALPEVFEKWMHGLDPQKQYALVVPDFVAALVGKGVWTSLPWHPRFRYERHLQVTPGIPYRGMCTNPADVELLPVNSLSVSEAESLLHPSSFLHAASMLQCLVPGIRLAAEMESEEAVAESEVTLQALMHWLFASAASGMKLQTTDSWGGHQGYRYKAEVLLQSILLTSKMTSPEHLRHVLMTSLRICLPAAVSLGHQLLSDDRSGLPSKSVLSPCKVLSGCCLHAASTQRLQGDQPTKHRSTWRSSRLSNPTTLQF